MQRKISGVLTRLVIAGSIMSVLILTFGIQPLAASGSWSAAMSPTDRTLTSVYMLSPTNGWAVGEDGTIIRWDGSSWSTISSPTKDFLMSVYMLSPTDGWAVGFPRHPGWAVGKDQGGTIIRWDGSYWATLTSPTTSSLYSVYMLSPTDGWAVGYRGTIIRWDGSSWSTVASPTKAHLYSVYMLSSTDGWARVWREDNQMEWFLLVNGPQPHEGLSHVSLHALAYRWVGSGAGWDNNQMERLLLVNCHQPH